jgi:hypothetical protein
LSADAAKLVDSTRLFGHIAVVLLTFLALFAIGGTIAVEATHLAGDLPRYKSTIDAKISSFRTTVATGGPLARTAAMLEDFEREISKPVAEGMNALSKTQSPGSFALNAGDARTVVTEQAILRPQQYPVRYVMKLIDFASSFALNAGDARTVVTEQAILRPQQYSVPYLVKLIDFTRLVSGDMDGACAMVVVTEEAILYSNHRRHVKLFYRMVVNDRQGSFAHSVEQQQPVPCVVKPIDQAKISRRFDVRTVITEKTLLRDQKQPVRHVMKLINGASWIALNADDVRTVITEHVDAFPYWGKFTSETALPG